MFSPLMFEGNPDQQDDNKPPVRVWKLGSIVNSFFIGCLPQILLVTMDQFRQVQLGYKNASGSFGDSNALIKHADGNTIFSIISLVLYIFLTTIFFSWERIFNENGVLYKYCKSRFTPCPSPCKKPQSEEPDPSIVNSKNDPENSLELILINTPANSNVNDIEEQKTFAEVTINNHYSSENSKWI